MGPRECAIVLQLRQHGSQGWQRFCESQAQQAEVRLGQKEHRHKDPELGREHRAEVGQEVEPQESQRAAAAGLGVENMTGSGHIRNRCPDHSCAGSPAHSGQQQEGCSYGDRW